jgi:hypothetical protein
LHLAFTSEAVDTSAATSAYIPFFSEFINSLKKETPAQKKKPTH